MSFQVHQVTILCKPDIQRKSSAKPKEAVC